RWLKSSNIKLPVIVFADWHETRCNFYLATALNKAGIHLFGLIPNATQMVQPLDLSFFKPFKVEYKRRAEAWRRENGMASINLVTFPSIALPSYSFCLQKESIQNGFRKAGIYPWNPDAVDYSRAAAIEAQAQVPDPLQGVDIAGRVHRGTDAYKTPSLCVETQTEWWGHCRHDPGVMLTSLDDDVIHRKRLSDMLCILNGRAMAFSRGLGFSIVTARTPEQILKAKKEELARAKKAQATQQAEEDPDDPDDPDDPSDDIIQDPIISAPSSRANSPAPASSRATSPVPPASSRVASPSKMDHSPARSTTFSV
ncbi:unnamed protein product, partial [Meganyctiphanes norvegica]